MLSGPRIPGAPDHQLFEIEQVLGCKLVAGPLAVCIESHAHEVSNLLVNAISDVPAYFSTGMLDRDGDVERQRPFQLQARSVNGNVLE